jgi:hypothetical protein
VPAQALLSCPPSSPYSHVLQVGFISDLPTKLVEAFSATLEEVVHSGECSEDEGAGGGGAKGAIRGGGQNVGRGKEEGRGTNAFPLSLLPSFSSLSST